MTKSLYIIAGEASGDIIGAGLIQALKAKTPDIEIHGIGGPLMEAQGLKSLFPMKELSLMGLFEIAPKVILILKRIKQTAEDIKQINPDYLVSIDAPDFSFRVHKAVKKASLKTESLKIKQVHYVAPTVWAWRPKRAKKIAQFLDGLICLFDFEPPYFEKENLKSIAVGHPMIESGIIEAKAQQIGRQDTQKLGVFMGSRQSELKRHGEIFQKAIGLVHKNNPALELVLPTLPHLKDSVEEILKPLDIPMHIITDQSDKWGVFKSCGAALAVSGTVGLELAVANIPHIIGYRMNPLTWKIVHRVIRTPYAHLANIIMQREIVPEYIQPNCTPENLAAGLNKLLNDAPHRQTQQTGFDDVRTKLGATVNSSELAVDFIFNV